MDSKHAASFTARRAAAVCSFVASALAMWVASAHADDTCQVDEKVLRDGIVSLSLSPAPPPTALELVSLGTITASAPSTPSSVWRILNNSATSYRAHLEAPGGERIPLLVRANSEITVRSDSLDSTAAHSLIVDNAAVDQAALAATTFVDDRELSGADCLFDGNPLYAGEHAGTLKISTVHGAVVTEIPGSPDLSAIATSQPDGNLWTLRGNSLRAFDWSGAEVENFTLPATATAGASGRQRIAVDGGSGDIWVAIGATLYRLNLYDDVFSVTYGEEIREIELNIGSGRLWVMLGSDVHVVRGDDDEVNDPIEQVAHIELPADANAITHDAYWNETWIVASSALLKYDRDGALLDTVPLTLPQAIQQLVADGAGGMWAASADSLFHVMPDGSVAIEIDAFAAGSSIVDLANDPADASAWVTSGARIRHFDRDGALLHDLLPAASGGGARQFRFLELFADRFPPDIRIVSPTSGATVSNPRPSIRIDYSDRLGRGLATNTLSVLGTQRQVLPMDCDADDSSAVCTPIFELPQGPITLWPRIYDLAGNLSGERPLSFTVQSAVLPQVYLNYPYEGMLTRSASVTVQGWVVDATGLTINGAPVTLDPANWFWHDVELAEGPNALTLIAVDAAGASTQLIVNVILDTIPPAAPNLSLIQVSVDEETGQLRLVAPPGTFEPSARVRVYNDDLGYMTYVVANQDGSLSAAVVAEPGHLLLITVGDEAGNERAQVPLPYTIDQMALTITSPSSTVTVATHDLVIRGTFTGPADASISANGIVAAISGNGGGRSFVVRVRLAAGENVIQVVAVAPGRPQIARQIIATRSGAAPFRIDASVTEGPAPLDVEFRVQRFDTTRIQRVEVDFEGDGVTDTVSEGSRVGKFLHEYLVPGSYTATFRIRTSTNALFTYQVPVVVNTAEERDLGIQATWQRFRLALAAADTSAALDCLMPSVAASYSSALTSLQSSLPQIAASFSDIHPTGAPGLAEYVLMRNVGGQPTAFLVYFARGNDGVWRIAGM